MSDPVRLDDAVLRERAYRWCGANQMTYSEWTVDELTKAFIALHDAARAEQREADAKIARNWQEVGYESGESASQICRSIAAAIRQGGEK